MEDTALPFLCLTVFTYIHTYIHAHIIYDGARSDVGNAVFETLMVKKESVASAVSTTGLAIGLLHVAAARGDAQAQLALAIRYRHGKQKNNNINTRVGVYVCI